MELEAVLDLIARIAGEDDRNARLGREPARGIEQELSVRKVHRTVATLVVQMRNAVAEELHVKAPARPDEEMVDAELGDERLDVAERDRAHEAVVDREREHA